MWYLYLDESGDLGFDFVNKKPSRFFTVCILATSHRESFVKISQAVRKTLSRKLNRHKKPLIHELKGKNTSIEVKQYFWRQVKDCRFGIYAITLNKRRIFENLTHQKERIYNFISRQVLDQIPFEKASIRVQMVIDKSKAKPEIIEFNNYIVRQLEGRLSPQIPINIDHLSSQKDALLQAVDLFAWGIFRKYERKEQRWYDVFKDKVLYDEQYL